MQRYIKEYSTFKHILERNSDFVRLSDQSPRIKTVDCYILYTMIQDAIRYKNVLKVEDEEYIFIRRAVT